MMLIETQYFPSILFWVYAQKSEQVVLEAWENYQKRSYRNKCRILGANGVLSLSIPLVKGKHGGLGIQEVRIDQSSHWKSVHIQSIRSAYGSAPYFDFYWEDVEGLIRMDIPLLYTFNMHIIRYFAKIFDIDVHESNAYRKSIPSGDLRHKVIPSLSYSLPHYAQVFEDRFPFESNLSILDLLFCKGPEAILYLKEVAALVHAE